MFRFDHLEWFYALANIWQGAFTTTFVLFKRQVVGAGSVDPSHYKIVGSSEYGLRFV